MTLDIVGHKTQLGFGPGFGGDLCRGAALYEVFIEREPFPDVNQLRRIKFREAPSLTRSY